jgi:hypothetical protein
MTDAEPNPRKTGGPYGGYDTFADWVAAEPDKFDAMDCRPSPGNWSEEYLVSTVPEHLRKSVRRVIAKRRAPRSPTEDTDQ